MDTAANLAKLGLVGVSAIFLVVIAGKAHELRAFLSGQFNDLEGDVIRASMEGMPDNDS